MVNILISGYYGFDNIGDESILRTLVSSLREHIPDCSLTVLSHNPASTREKYGVEAVERMSPMAILRAVNRPQWAQKVDKRLPVALFAGDADPVGDYGRGVESVYRALKDAGVKDVFLKLYPGARHEILNETNRAEVYADILAWCDAHQA